MARIRTFIGVDIGPSVRRSAEALQRQLAKTGAGVNWAAAATFHITLEYLGDVDDRDLVGVCRVVSDVAAGEPPFRLGVLGMGAFPTPRRPKIIWAGVGEGEDDLKRLFAALEPPLIELGAYRKEDRPYTPHLTLGRAKDEAAGLALAPELAKHQTWDGGQTDVEELIVYSSELRRDGPEYAVVGRGKLRGQRKPAG
jgi:2'-5' RNA ligase